MPIREKDGSDPPFLMTSAARVECICNMPILARRRGSLPSHQSLAGRPLGRLKTLTHPALLVVDENGYVPVTRSGAILFD